VSPDERIRPGSFGLIAHPFDRDQADDSRPQKNDPRPAAPYEKNPERWPQLPWYDRRTSKPVRVITITAEDDPETRSHQLSRGDVLIRTLGGVLGQYRRRAEHKSLAPDGTPAGEETTGLLQRRPVRSAPEQTELTGKESNKLEERLTGEALDSAECETSYGRRGDRWTRLVLPVLNDIGAPAIVRETGFKIRAIYNALNGGARPRSGRRSTYEDLAIAHATGQLATWNVKPPNVADAILARYLEERERRATVRRCEWCGKPIPANRRADARYCPKRCRKAAQRARKATEGGHHPGAVDVSPELFARPAQGFIAVRQRRC
jgi:hypothetical protein